MPFRGPWNVRLGHTFRPSAGATEMATTSSAVLSTRDKLLRARDAARELAQLSTAGKNTLLLAMAGAIDSHAASILAANREDLERSGLSGAMRDRLLLNTDRIQDMAQGIRAVAALSDPVYETLAEWTRPNGLRIRKVR